LNPKLNNVERAVSKDYCIHREQDMIQQNPVQAKLSSLTRRITAEETMQDFNTFGALDRDVRT
jgi:hypothetical protein